MKVDAEMKKMFHDIKLPVDTLDIEKELRKNGEKPATDTAKRRAAEQVHGRQPGPKKARKKPRGITSRTKLTNACADGEAAPAPPLTTGGGGGGGARRGTRGRAAAVAGGLGFVGKLSEGRALA
ncbi:hypothetical protein TRIUR3_02225 [Triticum urartu]|uniref:Uncharacterized protein n=1 Tax=Triticum urartu TaxID=4572 RepID=M8A3U6_TRIUA|nr:hypothetical protein TRIUR3_02225 [Triticum urartu]